MTVMLIGMPIMFLLLFVYVFGGTLGAGLGGAAGGRAEYVNYVTPAIILMTIAAAAQGTAISVAMDMTEGIVDRFRTMAIARVSVLTGHVLGSLIQTMLGIAAVIGVALLIGFRPDGRPASWLGLAGVLVMMAFAFIWLSVAFGLASKTVEAASNVGMPLILLPFLGSGFVPTDSMPTALRLVRRVPAVHPAHRNHPRSADGHSDREQRRHRHRLVRRHHLRRLPLVEETVQPRVHRIGRHRVHRTGDTGNRSYEGPLARCYGSRYEYQAPCPEGTSAPTPPRRPAYAHRQMRFVRRPAIDTAHSPR